MSELTEQIKRVHEARQKAQDMKLMVAGLRHEWETQYAELIATMNDADDERLQAEVRLRDMTFAAYAQTGNKKPAPGVGIREVTRLEYDPNEAFSWAKEHALALQLDKKAFEKIAKASMQMPFVTAVTEPQATISPDLNEAVKEIGDGEQSE